MEKDPTSEKFTIFPKSPVEYESAIKEAEESPKGPPTEGSPLQVVDLYFPYNNFFSRASKRAMAVKVKRLRAKDKLSVIRDISLTCDVHYPTVAVRAVGEEAVWKAAKAVCRAVNDLSQKGYVRGFVAPLCALKLATEPHELEQWVVASIPMVSDEGQALLEEDAGYRAMLCGDGAMPEAFVVAE